MPTYTNHVNSGRSLRVLNRKPRVMPGGCYFWFSTIVFFPDEDRCNRWFQLIVDWYLFKWSVSSNEHISHRCDFFLLLALAELVILSIMYVCLWQPKITTPYVPIPSISFHQQGPQPRAPCEQYIGKITSLYCLRWYTFLEGQTHAICS